MTEPPVQPPARTTSGRSAAVVRDRARDGNPVYGFGLIGSLVYFWQQADGFWQYVLAVLKAIVWPALLAYDAFRSLKG